MALRKLKFKTSASFSTLFFLYSFVFVHSDLLAEPHVFSSIRSGSRSNDTDAAYMSKLLKALTPPHWSNNTKYCQWSGVSCDESGFVQEIDLYSKSLTGILPSGLNDSLLFLTRLDLSNNSLHGPLPSLANLDQLQYVDLSDNNFTSIPYGCFQGLTGLEKLYLDNNVNLAPWKFPSDLSSDSNSLETLSLGATNLMGSLPDIFDSFPRLNYLRLSSNNLSGALPNSFVRPKVEYLYLDLQKHEKLSGTIEVLSSMIHLNDLRLQGNHFNGTIPDMSNCTNLYHLELQDNQLTGVVPPSLVNLSGLSLVYLDHNFLQGPIPVFNDTVNVSLGVNSTNSFCLDRVGPCDERVTTLLEIAALLGYPIQLARSWRGNNPCKGWNFITCDGSKIITVNLTNLNLTGTISSAFANLADLRNLYLGDNNLWGSIPERLATLPQLEVVDVSNNHLSGNIPRFSPEVRFNVTGNMFPGPSQSQSHLPAWMAGVLEAGAGVIVILVVVICNRKRCLRLVKKMMFRKTRTCIDQNVEEFLKSYGSLALKRYSYSEVKKMTSSFREKLGQGGYGTVYKASLTDDCQVAVKVLSESNGSGEEFINEVASISRTSHVNIVSLLGFCYEMNKRALVYGFMHNGSLDKFIYKNGSSNAICDLDWNTLYQISIGIARGLEYLHRGYNTRILHLDIKPQNILLDEDFCPKIADFGLAKICKKKESIVSILGTRGTPGYIAPEIFSRTYGGVSHKSDVYSYGMLILEVVGGRKNYDTGGSNTSELYFPDWIYKDLEQGNIPTTCLVNTEEENDMVMKITLVSLWCIQANPSARPSISKVVEMLEGPLQSVPYPPKPILNIPEWSMLQLSDISYSSAHEIDSITPVENGSIK